MSRPLSSPWLALALLLTLALAGCQTRRPAVAPARPPTGPNPYWRPAPAGPTASGPLTPYEADVVRLVNEQRARGGVCGGQAMPPAAPLVVLPQLVAAARAHSWDMGLNNYLDHRSRDGRGVGDRVRAAGYVGRGWGENIAQGHSSPQEVMQGWMISPGHCRNILNASFRFIGVGHAYTPAAAMQHSWTQDFGS